MTTLGPRTVPLEDYMLDESSSYVKLPTVPLPDGSEILVGDDVWRTALTLAQTRSAHPLVAVDIYPGGDVAAIVARIRAALPETDVVDVEEAAAAAPEAVESLIARNLTDDRVFGVMSHFTISEFYENDRLAALQRRVRERSRPMVLVGWGADLAADRQADALVLVDLARWEIQQRLRAGAPNWRADNGDEDVLRKYKRGFFVEWRTADRHKRDMFDRVDLVVDGNAGELAGAVRGADFRAALKHATTGPLRVVPFFDPGRMGWTVDEVGA